MVESFVTWNTFCACHIIFLSFFLLPKIVQKKALKVEQEREEISIHETVLTYFVENEGKTVLHGIQFLHYIGKFCVVD